MDLRIAFVKSSIYTDLWVSDTTNDYFKLFKTSFMRCPPIGLAENYKTDFIIVKESREYPCQTIVYPWEVSFKNSIKYSTSNKNPGLPFLDETHHKDVTVDSISYNADDIDWNKYDIIITINACIPHRIVEKYPTKLWCYYVSENDDHMTNYIIGGYDLILNQDVMKNNLPPFSIGFPYTFLGPYTIENMNKQHLDNNITRKHGIFMEINNTTQRPVVDIPNGIMEVSKQTGHPIVRHDQNIIENTKNLYQSKYYIKLYGRVIRGNSVMESISAGTLTLINKNLTMYPDLIPNICHIENPADAIQRIRYFDENPNEYNLAVKLQKESLNKHYYSGPMKNLFQKYYQKNGKNTQYLMTLTEWQKMVKPASELIYNASVQNGNDEWLPFTIGIGYKFYYLKDQSIEIFQLGSHEKTVISTITTTTDIRRRGHLAINRANILKTLLVNNIPNFLLDYQQYFRELPTYKFVISPEGNGVDCHRHYEALMAGCIPIVEHNDLVKEKYKNCPILYTTDYSEITKEYLEEKYEEMRDKVYDFSSLFLNSYTESMKQQIIANGNYWCQRLTGDHWYK